jgi:hypothetical protein
MPHRVRRELFLGKELVQADQFLVHDAAGADVFVADLAVAHLAVGQADIKPAGRDQCHREISREACRPPASSRGERR